MQSIPSNEPESLSLWERISNDPAFLKAKREVQKRYGLPLPYDIRLEHDKWLGWMNAGAKRGKRGTAFLKSLHALFKRFEIPETWEAELIADIAGTRSSAVPEWALPRFNLYLDSEENLKWECIVTPETDLTNPRVLGMIQSAQKEYAGDPPQPVKAKDHPRTLDWSPVFEWHKRHPLFSHEEIAKKLHRPIRIVRQKLAGFEEDG